MPRRSFLPTPCSKVLLDTNVMLDLALARPEGFDAAAAIAEAVAYEEVVAYVCATSLKDLYYILSKAMGEKDARTSIKAVMDDFRLQIPTSLISKTV